MDSFKELSKRIQNSTSNIAPPIANASMHTRAFADPDLSQLREQIKKIMIPTLIKAFELRLAAQQASMPPSRLTGCTPDLAKVEEIRQQLEKLQDDLKLLHLWCESCENQVSKVMQEVLCTAEKLKSQEPHDEP